MVSKPAQLETPLSPAQVSEQLAAGVPTAAHPAFQAMVASGLTGKVMYKGELASLTSIREGGTGLLQGVKVGGAFRDITVPLSELTPAPASARGLSVGANVKVLAGPWKSQTAEVLKLNGQEAVLSGDRRVPLDYLRVVAE